MRRCPVLLLVFAAALFASCKDATQVEVVLRTNVPHLTGTNVAIWSSRSGAVGSPVVESGEAWRADGEIGSVVVTPGEALHEAPLSLRVAMGLRGKRAADCTDDSDLKDCIVARRSLAFVPHVRLRVPVVMYLACEGVKCATDATCSHLGQCVPAQLVPSACATTDGCTLPGEPPFVPGVPAVVDAGTGDLDAPATAVDTGTEDTGIVVATPDAAGDVDAAPAPIGPELGAGEAHTCAKLGDGTVKCWGVGGSQLGLGDVQNRGSGPGEMGAALPNVDLGPGRTALQVVAGGAHTCARLDDGTIKCWGANSNGQLGLGDTQNRGSVPGQLGATLPTVDIGAGRTALQLAAGNLHTCARLDDGTVKCWGFNAYGQLGLGDTADRGGGPGEMGTTLPIVNLGPGRTALQLGAGLFHTCARLDDGTVKCWGFNDFGQLGLGDVQRRGELAGDMGATLPAIDLGPGRTALQVAVGGYHTCARLDDGTVKCWGRNAAGILGLGDALIRGDGPGQMGAALPAIDLGSGRTALQIAAGWYHTCAKLNDGATKCWGDNEHGQLGVGDNQARGDIPGQLGATLPAVDLGPGRTAMQLIGGLRHTCASLDDGTVKCWGHNAAGRLGLGDVQNRGDGPGEMGAALPVVQLK